MNIQIIFLFLLVITLSIYISFCINMQNAMNAISKENRKMEGGLIWLNLVPILNLVWPIIFNNALKVSYSDEFRKKGIIHDVNLSSGLIYPSAQLLSVFMYIFIFSTAFSNQSNYYSGYNEPISSFMSLRIANVSIFLLGLLSFILWIVFWVNTMKMKNMLSLSSGVYSQVVDGVKYSEMHARAVEEPINYTTSDVTAENHIINQAQVSNEQIKEVSSGDKIKKYHDMLNEGLITQADFDRIKKELLNQ